MKLVHFLFGKMSAVDLRHLDTFYQDTVSHLCPQARKQYCVNLIGRLREDLKQTICPVKHSQIKEHIRAAEKEIQKLIPLSN